MITQRQLRQLQTALPRLSYGLRSLSTSAPTSTPTTPSTPSHQPSPSPSSRPPPLEATTFDGKSAPRIVHERPEALRGLPPASHHAPWEKAPTGASAAAAVRKEGARAGEDFAGPSRPRLVYERPGGRDLPILKNRIPLYVALATLGLGAWGLFILHATNNERLSSSVLRQVTFQLRNSPEVASILGDRVRLADNWWGFGEPWISGGINLMQGRIDLKFRIQGTKDSGTVFFTSIRPQQAAAWRIVRYKVIADGGDVLRLEDKVVRGADVAAVEA